MIAAGHPFTKLTSLDFTVDDETVQQTPDVACETVKTFVQGLLAMDGRMISLISLDHVLPERDLDGAGEHSASILAA